MYHDCSLYCSYKVWQVQISKPCLNNKDYHYANSESMKKKNEKKKKSQHPTSQINSVTPYYIYSVSKWVNKVMRQSLALTLFPACPVRQVEENSTCPAPFFGCMNFSLHAPTKSKAPKTNYRVQQLSSVWYLFWKFMHFTVVICYCCFTVQNYCFYLAFVYCQCLDQTCWL